MARLEERISTLIQRLDKVEDIESRVRTLEDWRTSLRAQMAVLTVVASILSAVLTAVAIKIIDRAVLPQPTVVSPIVPSREDARRLDLP